MTFRPATAADTDVPALMHDASRAALDATFELRPGTTADFLACDFDRGDGIFGWRRQIVAVDPADTVIATATVYEGSRYRALSLHTVRSAGAHFGPVDLARILRRTAASATLFPPPRAGTLYLANFCVRPQARSTGQGSRLLDHVAGLARARGLAAIELDVAFSNPRARAMYEGNGFKVTGERRARRPSAVEGVHRMSRAAG